MARICRLCRNGRESDDGSSKQGRHESDRCIQRKRPRRESWAHFTMTRSTTTFRSSPSRGSKAIRDVIQGFMGMATQGRLGPFAISRSTRWRRANRTCRPFLINGKWVALPVMGTFEVVNGKISSVARLLRHEPIPVAAREVDVNGEPSRRIGSDRQRLEGRRRCRRSVSAGDTLIILESMKMEIPLESPVAGRVSQLLVSPQDVVEEGQVLVVIGAVSFVALACVRLARSRNSCNQQGEPCPIS